MKVAHIVRSSVAIITTVPLLSNFTLVDIELTMSDRYKRTFFMLNGGVHAEERLDLPDS